MPCALKPSPRVRAQCTDTTPGSCAKQSTNAGGTSGFTPAAIAIDSRCFLPPVSNSRVGQAIRSAISAATWRRGRGPTHSTASPRLIRTSPTYRRTDDIACACVCAHMCVRARGVIVQSTCAARGYDDRTTRPGASCRERTDHAPRTAACRRRCAMQGISGYCQLQMHRKQPEISRSRSWHAS